VRSEHVIQLQLAAEIADLQTCIKQGRALLKEGAADRLDVDQTTLRHGGETAAAASDPVASTLVEGACRVDRRRATRAITVTAGRLLCRAGVRVTQGLAQELGPSYHGPPQASLGIAPPIFRHLPPAATRLHFAIIGVHHHGHMIESAKRDSEKGPLDSGPPPGYIGGSEFVGSLPSSLFRRF
jgi:hypothetical protein